MRPLSICIIGVLLLWPGQTSAQVDADSVKIRNACRLAEQVISTGRPAPHTEWALSFIAACGSEVYGRAIAQGVRRLRSVQDTAVLQQYWRPSHFLTDLNFYDAAVEIAQDRTASTEARVFAFLALVRMSDPVRVVEYRDLLGGFHETHGLRGVGGGCRSGSFGYPSRLVGTPLPDDYRRRIADFSASIREDGSEPEDVRTSAACAVVAAR